MRDLGIVLDPAATRIQPLGGGWSGSRLWTIAQPSGSLVLRILPATGIDAAEREAAIHALVLRFMVPAPEIVAVGAMSGGDATMVMTLMPGIPLAQALLATPGIARDLGRRCGTMLARIHEIPESALAEAGIAAGGTTFPGDWLTWNPGEADDRVQEVLAPWRTPSHESRLLHLDFHPENLLVDPETSAITAVLDWTNARLGPPVADLARTRSILRLIATLPDLPPGARRTPRHRARREGEPGVVQIP